MCSWSWVRLIKYSYFFFIPTRIGQKNRAQSRNDLTKRKIETKQHMMKSLLFTMEIEFEVELQIGTVFGDFIKNKKKDIKNCTKWYAIVIEFVIGQKKNYSLRINHVNFSNLIRCWFIFRLKQSWIHSSRVCVQSKICRTHWSAVSADWNWFIFNRHKHKNKCSISVDRHGSYSVGQGLVQRDRIHRRNSHPPGGLCFATNFFFLVNRLCAYI